MTSNNRRMFLKKASLLASALGLTGLPAFAKKSENPQTNLPKITRKTINLWADNSPNNHVSATYGRPRIELYIPESTSTQKRAAILVCPGGGYHGLAAHEGAPFAELFAQHGIVAAVLTYHVAPHRFPLPYSDACRGMRLLRSQAKELNIDEAKVGIIGFSAGGHLASTVATQPDLFKDPEDNLATKLSARPDRVMLGYPVISFLEYGHKGSAVGLLGDKADTAQLSKFSNELQVTAQNPPAFIFHTSDDPVVMVENSLQFAAAYHKYKIPVALHVYPKGSHGVGLALNNAELKSWSGLMLDWLGDWKAS